MSWIIAGSITSPDTADVPDAGHVFGDSVVAGELPHAARPTRLVASGRGLVGDVDGRNQPVGERDAVLGPEQHLESPAHRRLAVDGYREVVQELDDQLGQSGGTRGAETK